MAPGPRTARLLVLASGVLHRLVLCRPAAVIIGRARDCDVLIDDPSVSRHHLHLSFGEDLLVQDLGSTNGTYLEGRLIQGPRSLSPGRRLVLRVGDVEILLQLFVSPRRWSVASRPR